VSRLSLELDAVFPHWRIRRRIRHSAGLEPGIRIVLRDDPAISVPRPDPAYPFSRHDGPFQVRLSREAGTILVSCDMAGVRAIGAWAVGLVGRRSAILVRLLAEAEAGIDGFLAMTSDFCPAGLVGFCSSDPRAILVPDSDFFNSRGYADARKLAATAPPWRERSDAIVWRGATRGFGDIADEGMSPGNLKLLPRTRMCLILKEVPRADGGFTHVAQSKNQEKDKTRLRRAGLLAGRVPLPEWTRRRFAIDIDGNTNAWSNLFNRLLLGCCVIKVGSERDFRQWYYGDLVPWRHYVPVKPDMSDMVEKIEWCRSHPDECEAIASEGQALAMAMTLERELARGVQTINRAFGEDAGQAAPSSVST
jgi:hypothetical protein